MSAFSIELPTDNKDMAAFQEVMNAYYDSVNQHIVEISKELGISSSQASDVWYLRDRSRWSPELETRLLACYKAGHSLNIMDDTNAELIKLGF